MCKEERLSGKLTELEQAQILSEYTALKQETISRCNEGNTLYLFALTSVSAIWALTASSDEPQPGYYLLALVILLIVRSRYFWWESGLERLGSYIRL